MSELTLETNARYSELHSAYAFYSFQIVEMTATLTLDADTNVDHLPVVFKDVGSKPGLQLAPYGQEGQDWYPVQGREDEVRVYMTQVDPRHGVAVLHALVVGQASAQGSTSASIGSDYASAPIPYCTFGINAHVTSYPGILDTSEVDQTPSSSQGNYLYYRLQVTADGSDGELAACTGLPDMCIRLTAAGADQNAGFLESVCIYDDYDARIPLIVDTGKRPLSLDLTTDADGVANLYVCAKAETTACARLTCKAGIVEPQVGPILVADTQAFGTSPKAPYCANPVALGQADAATTEASVPQDYVGASPSDQIFVFCNGRFQSAGALSQSQFPFQLACLRSEALAFGDTTGNALYYVASGGGMVRVSSAFSFDATGTPPQAELEQVSADHVDTLDAPSIREAGDGWPINCGTIAGGLSIDVPVDARMRLGDQIVIQMALNGYRLASDEPTGMCVPPAGDEAPWPSALVVTSLAQQRGSIEWRYQPYHFMGFGQLHSADDTSGSLGTLTVRYLVVRPGEGVAYCSEIQSIGIDTIPPSGQPGITSNSAITVPF